MSRTPRHPTTIRRRPRHAPIWALLTLIGVLSGCGGGPADSLSTAVSPPSLSTVPDTSMLATATTTSGESTQGPQVPMIDCRTLITMPEIEEALDVWNRPSGEMNTIGFSRGEVCIEEMAHDDSIFLRIEPGDPEDFESGAELRGVPGDPVNGVGDEALFFDRDDRDGVGVLSVRQDTPLGVLYFRITLSRPELDGAARLEIVTTLAVNVLPRFPWVEEPEPEVITYAPEPVDLSDGSYRENLLTKVADDEWTLGEGLVATLRLFAGEIDASEVLRHPDLMDYSATGVTGMAEAYLETGPDEEARAEIARLLDLIFPSVEERAAMAGDGQSSPDASGDGRARALPLYQAGNDSGRCMDLYGVASPCVRPVLAPDLEANEQWRGRFAVWRPRARAIGDWTLARIDATVDALTDSVKKYSTLGEVRPIAIYLINKEEAGVTTNVSHEDGTCIIWVSPYMQVYEEHYYKQFLARDIAYCFLGTSYHSPSGWWYTDGLATYLSGWVYPDVNLEHRTLPGRLEEIELSTILMERGFTTWIFFEHLHPFVGADGNLSLMRGIPATMENLRGAWHPFNEQLTDAAVPDIDPGTGTILYQPPYFDEGIVGPRVWNFPLEPWGIVRAQFTVDAGKTACIEYEPTGEFQATWRPGLVWSPAGDPWSADLPTELSDVGSFVITATHTDAKLTIRVKKVVDDPEDCKKEDEPNGGGVLDECPPDFCEGTRYVKEH